MLNGDSCPPVNSCNSLALSHFAAARNDTNNETAWGFAPGPIVLDNTSPCRGVVVEANFHNSICDAGVGYSGAFAAGVRGLRSESNDCSHCQQRPKAVGSCHAVGTGPFPRQIPCSTGASCPGSAFSVIELNTGAFGHGDNM